jgi:hypothetical protein
MHAKRMAFVTVTDAEKREYGALRPFDKLSAGAGLRSHGDAPFDKLGACERRGGRR